MTDPENVVVVGNGQAGIQLVDSLRKEGYTGPITLLGEEPHHPYQRPPLSKDYLAAGKDPVPLPLRPEKFFTTNDVDARLGVRVTAIDRDAKTVALDDGTTLAYSNPGAGHRRRQPRTRRARRRTGRASTACAPSPTPRPCTPRLDAARAVVVIGAGFIGLEFAAAARARGLRRHRARVRRPADGPGPDPGDERLVRRRPPATSASTCAWARASPPSTAGDGHVAAAVSTTGERYPADLVLVGVGVVPRTRTGRKQPVWRRRTASSWTAACAPPTRTSTPSATARTSPNAHAGARTRLESVQNATDQARHAARAILGARTRDRLRRPALVLVQPGPTAPADRRPGSPRTTRRCSAGTPADGKVLRVLLPQRRPGRRRIRQPARRPHGRPPPARRRPHPHPRTGRRPRLRPQGLLQTSTRGTV